MGISMVKGVDLDTSVTFSGQVTVTTAGTAVQGPNIPLTNGAIIKALGANIGKIYLYYKTGDNRALGYELSADWPVPVQVSNMNQVWFDCSVSGEKACWIKG